MTQPPQSGGFNPEAYEQQIRQAQEQAQRQYEQQAQQAQQAYGQAPQQPQSPQFQPQYAEGQGSFEQPKKQFPVRKVISGVVGVAVLGVGGYVVVNQFMDSAALKVGQCVTFSGESDNAEHAAVDCTDASKFSYLITQVDNNGVTSCSESEVIYEYSTRGRRSTSTKTVCLIPNFQANTCYNEVSTIEDFEVADCGSAQYKVVSVNEGTTAECVAPAEPITYANRTYCVEFL